LSTKTMVSTSVQVKSQSRDIVVSETRTLALLIITPIRGAQSPGQG
jgi:hypothetical protein